MSWTPPTSLMRASIIIPVYNVGPYLAQCLRSAVEQDYAQVEIITIDDGSTDNSPDVLKAFAANHPNITVVRTENRGPAAARNIGLGLASGEYVLFLDGDDYLEKHAVSLCMQKMREHEVDIVFFAARSFYDGMEPRGWGAFNYERSAELTHRPMRAEDFFVQSRNRSNYLPSACLYMYRRARLSDIYFYPGVLHEDNLFTTRLLLEHKDTRVICLPDPLFNRRLRPNSIMTQRKQPRHVEGYLAVALELSRLDAARERSDTGECLNRFIQNMIRSALAQWWIAYPSRLPLSLRRQLLGLLLRVQIRYLQPRCVLACLAPELLWAGHRARGNRHHEGSP